jgi:mobilization protein NikA
MKRLKLSNKISYRVSEEQWRRIEEEAEDAGVSANDWCRNAALEKLKNLREVAEKSPPAETGNGTGRVADERALLEEIARLGYLIEHGFGIQLSANRTTDEEWIRRKKESKSVAARLVEMMLERRSSGAGMG